MCTAKGVWAQLFSVLTSLLNSVLQMGKANVGYLYAASGNVDKNADAVLTITTTAITGFFTQVP
jgi:hypothetical protein